jgi:exonuclease III
MPRGCEGTAILWKQELDSFITPLSVGTDRIQVNEVLGEQNLIILSVYMPCKGTSDHLNELNNCIDQLHEIMVTYKNMHQIIIVGDFNEDFVNGKNSKKTQH